MGAGVPGMTPGSWEKEHEMAAKQAEATRRAMDEQQRRWERVDTPERHRYDPSGNSWKGKGRLG
jgi:hypothetical protein